jgi:hypothetical protein
MIDTHDASGRIQEMACLHLDAVPMWLVTIEASRVAEDIRPKLDRYQREAALVLAEYFFGKKDAVLAVLSPETMAVIKQVADGIALPIVAASRLRAATCEGLKQDPSPWRLPRARPLLGPRQCPPCSPASRLFRSS